MRLVRFAFLVVLLLYSFFAVQWVGYLFGWLIAASNSPVVAIAAPSVFGLLAVIGIGAGIRATLVTRRELFRGACVAIGIWLFCAWCWEGINLGVISRTLPYTEMSEMIDPHYWITADPNIKAQIYSFRNQAKQAGVLPTEFQGYVVDIITPILADKDRDKNLRIEKAISIIERGFNLPPLTPQQTPTSPSPAL